MAHSIGYLLLYAVMHIVLPSLTRHFAELEIEAEKLRYIFNENSATATSEPTVYDFVIVGGGSAGAVLANRISKKYNTLLIERGGESIPVQLVPIVATGLLNNPDVDYRYHTVPQKSSCLSLNNNSSLWSRGKHLGGSSNLNLQIYLRGHPKDYENWVNITGDARWSYENVLEYFKKSENYCTKCENSKNDPTFNPKYHHQNGYLSLTRSDHPLIESFLKASEWNGIPRTDLNGPYTEGCSPLIFTEKNGRRSSTGTAFLDPVRHRKTLTIQKFSRAYKILLRKNGENSEAYGIEYEKFGMKHVVHASKEVIISAGSIESPKLLMLSGIGPNNHLQSLGIPVHANLPVGQNLQDHISTIVGPFLINETSSLLLERDISLKDIEEYVTHGTGTLSYCFAGATSCFSAKSAEQNDEDWPTLQHFFNPAGVTKIYSELYSSTYDVDKRMSQQYFQPVEGRDAFFILVMLSRPKSRGELLLRSTDYRDDPVIDPKYFENIQDLNILLEGVKDAINISENSPSFSKLGAHISKVPWPSCAHFEFLSDDYWICYIRNLSLTVWHYVGTCSMGNKGKQLPASVVDEELRVIGVNNLRVIDASVMPELVSVNTNAPTIMIAERGAQLILDTYSKL